MPTSVKTMRRCHRGLPAALNSCRAPAAYPTFGKAWIARPLVAKKAARAMEESIPRRSCQPVFADDTHSRNAFRDKPARCSPFVPCALGAESSHRRGIDPEYRCLAPVFYNAFGSRETGAANPYREERVPLPHGRRSPSVFPKPPTSCSCTAPIIPLVTIH